MKVLTGHLTATDKRNIKLMLDSKSSSASINGITYSITKNWKEDTYTVKRTKKDRGMIPVPGSPLRFTTDTSTFKL